MAYKPATSTSIVVVGETVEVPVEEPSVIVYVKDTLGRPVKDAIVELWQQRVVHNQPVIDQQPQSVTDENGKAVFQYVPDGTGYLVFAHKTNGKLVSEIKQFTLKFNEKKEFSLTIYPAPHTFKLVLRVKGNITEENKNQIANQILDEIYEGIEDVTPDKVDIKPITLEDGSKAWEMVILFTINALTVGLILALIGLVIAIVAGIVIISWYITSAAGPLAPFASLIIAGGLAAAGVIILWKLTKPVVEWITGKTKVRKRKK